MAGVVALAVVVSGCWVGDAPEQGSASPTAPATPAAETAELAPGQATTVRRDGFELTVPGAAVAAGGSVRVADVARGRARRALAEAGVPARVAGAPVAIATDARLREPARLAWQLDATDPDVPVAAVRRGGDGALEVVAAERDGDTLAVAADGFSKWWPIEFDADSVDDLVHGVVAPFEAQRVAPVAEPTCRGRAPSSYTLTSPDHDRMRWCAGVLGNGQLRVTVANNRAGAAQLAWTGGDGAEVELIDRSDAEISIARGAQALLEAIENQSGPETTYVPRGATATFAVDAAPGQIAAVRSSVAPEAVLIDALVLGVDLYLTVVGAVGGDAARDRAVQLLDSADTVSCVSGVASRLPRDAGRGEAVAEGVRLVVDCLSEQLDEALAAAGGAAVGVVAGVVSMAVTAAASLITSGQGIYDELTGKGDAVLGIEAHEADSPESVGRRFFRAWIDGDREVMERLATEPSAIRNALSELPLTSHVDGGEVACYSGPGAGEHTCSVEREGGGYWDVLVSQRQGEWHIRWVARGHE